jgi:hypothetical protein
MADAITLVVLRRRLCAAGRALACPMWLQRGERVGCGGGDGGGAEALAAEVAEVRTMIEKARAEQAERARVAAERLQAEEEVAALTLVMQSG